MSNAARQDPKSHTINADAPLVNFRSETIGKRLGETIAEHLYSWQRIPPGVSAVRAHRLALKLDAGGTFEVEEEGYNLILTATRDAPLVPWCKLDCLYLLDDPEQEEEERTVLAARHAKAEEAAKRAALPENGADAPGYMEVQDGRVQ